MFSAEFTGFQQLHRKDPGHGPRDILGVDARVFPMAGAGTGTALNKAKQRFGLTVKPIESPSNSVGASERRHMRSLATYREAPPRYIPRARVDQMTLPPSADRHLPGGEDGAQVPGVLLVFSGGAACARSFRVPTGGLELGRDAGSGAGTGKIDDGRVSRRHAQVALKDGRCLVTDLGSQNGTFVDGGRVAANTPTLVQRVFRVGDSLLIPCRDVRPFERDGVMVAEGFVRGPAMRRLLDEVAVAARSGSTLHIRGENGTGKEGVAQAFHRASPRASRQLIAVNCAAIPHAIAERLLFGVKRGAYSGAEADAPGYVQEADGSTLFLDEVAELDLQIQAKLLRVLESHELMPLGASKPRKVDFALCSATNKDLRTMVANGALREDLYFRIGRPAVLLPPLRNRPEEIATLIGQELARQSAAPAAHVSLVEQCLLRPWPGNVRELLAETRIAAQAAAADGNRVEARHLSTTAGTVFGSAMPEARRTTTDPPVPPGHGSEPPESPRRRVQRDDAALRPRIEEALKANAGNVAATARALGMHRTQLRRLLDRYGIAVDAGEPGDPSDNDDTD